MRDIDIRNQIKKSYFKKYYEDTKSRVVEELLVGYGDAIIDMAVINGSLHGFEIKSEYDTLHRLPHQLTAYSKTFDFVTIVTAQKHLKHLDYILPKWCGILAIDSSDKMKYLRKPKKNRMVENYAVAQLLWKEEAIDLLNSIGITSTLSNKSKPILWQLLADSLPQRQLKFVVREKLKLRPKWKLEKQPFENGDYFQLSAKL